MLNENNIALSARMGYTFTRGTDGLFTLSVHDESKCFDASLLTKLSVSNIDGELVVMVKYGKHVFEFLPAWNRPSKDALTSGAYCLVGKNALWPAEHGDCTITFIKKNNGKYMCNLSRFITFSYAGRSWFNTDDCSYGFVFSRVFADGVTEVIRVSDYFYGRDWWVPITICGFVDVNGKLNEETLNEIASYAAHYFPDKPFKKAIHALCAHDVIEFQYDAQAQDDKIIKACCAWKKKHNKKN